MTRSITHYKKIYDFSAPGLWDHRDEILLVSMIVGRTDLRIFSKHWLVLKAIICGAMNTRQTKKITFPERIYVKYDQERGIFEMEVSLLH